MREKRFRFKQFSVINDKSAMKVGTDGVLLGAWTTANDDIHSVLDVGAGTGLVSLMLAQRNPVSLITGIEIDTDAVEECNENFINSPWCSRLSVIHADFNKFAENTESKYDLIVSNPPFFDNGIKAMQQSRAVARHSDTLSISSLIISASKLLTRNGILSIIFPYDGYSEIIEACKECNLKTSRITKVYPTPTSQPKRLLIELTNSDNQLRVVEDCLVIEHSRQVYSTEYIDLTKDFYLKM